MNRVEISKNIKEVLENYGIPPKELKPTTSFINDLGLDSLDFAELILTVEQIFDVSISFDHDNIHTIDDLVNTIEQLISKKKITKPLT